MEDKSVNRLSKEKLKQYQDYMRKYEKDDNLVILEAVDKPGSKPGDNYTSVLIKTKLVGTRNGNQYIKFVITKSIVDGRAVSKILDLHDLFRMEAHVYRKILPTLGSNFGPACIYANKETIIMEDLSEKGYVICERRNFLDLNHTVFALKKLAKFHASALAVKIKKPQCFHNLTASLEEVIYSDNSATARMRHCTDMCVSATIKTLEAIEPRTQELQTVIDHIVSRANNAYDSLYRMFNAPRHKYHVISHGDLWINNMLFLHDNNGKILDLKLVDYQITRHASQAVDIHHLIYTSVQSSLIEKSYESLITLYHTEFLKELRRLDVDEKILAELDREWLETELETYAFYGALLGCWMVNAILAEEEDIKQFETIEFDPNNPSYDTNVNMMNSNPDKLRRVKSVALHYYNRYILGIINDVEPISVTT